GRRRRDHRRARPRRPRRRDGRRSAAREPAPDRLHLPLRLRDRGRGRRLRHLVSRRIGRVTAMPILSLVTFLPLLGAAIIMITGGDEATKAKNARSIALWTSLIVFFLSLQLWFGFDASSPEFQFVERVEWIPSFNIAYHMGIDGISLFLVLLSTFLTPICVLASWESVQYRVKEYMIAFLVLETMMVG